MSDEIVEEKEKGYGEGMAVMDPAMGATSFAELDLIERTHDRYGKFRKIIDSFTAMVRNIMQSDAVDVMEKPALIRNVTEEMRARLDADFEMGERSTKEETYPKFNFDVWGKAATKTEGGIEYAASDYADVPDMDTPSTWKLRLAEDRSGNFTVAQVARAITAMQPSGFRGNRVELGQPKATVVSKISAVINKTDGTDEQKQNLRERLNAVKAIDFAHNTGFKVLKSVNGDYRWLGWVSNKFMDREGEILTEKAHTDYVDWLTRNPSAAPQLWTYHIPGTGRKNKTDFWTYLNGFLILGGKLTEQEAKAIESYNGDLGMSHGFYVLDKRDNLINKYRTFEATVLPYKAAANLWTKFNVKEMRDMANMSKEQRELAVQLHGEEFVAALESDTQKMATNLNDAGVQSKAEHTEEDEEKMDEEKSVDLNLISKAVASEVIKQLNPQGLQDAMKALSELSQSNADSIGVQNVAIENIVKRLEALEKTDDEKVSKQFEAKVKPGIDWMNGFRASASKETVIQEDEKEKFEKAKPNESWVTSAFSFGGQ